MIDIKKMVKENPHELVVRLKASDMEYWEALKESVIVNFLVKDSIYASKIKDKNIDIDDVYSYLYEQLVLRGALEGLRSEDSIIAFILSYVRGYIDSFYGRRGKNTDDDSGCKQSRKEMVLFNDAGMDKDMLENIASPEVEEFNDSQFLTYRNTREGFNMLWEKNTKRAMALLLRYVKGLSAEEVRQFMCLASENYVNQVVSIAKGDMRKKYLSIDKVLKGDE
jgi:hypothetical protein